MIQGCLLRLDTSETFIHSCHWKSVSHILETVPEMGPPWKGGQCPGKDRKAWGRAKTGPSQTPHAQLMLVIYTEQHLPAEACGSLQCNGFQPVGCDPFEVTDIYIIYVIYIIYYITLYYILLILYYILYIHYYNTSDIYIAIITVAKLQL